MPVNRMNRDEFYAAMAPHDDARLRKILWTVYCPGTCIASRARFLADGKNRTALLSAQGLPGGTVAGFRCSGGTGCATVSASP